MKRLALPLVLLTTVIMPGFAQDLDPLLEAPAAPLIDPAEPADLFAEPVDLPPAEPAEADEPAVPAEAEEPGADPAAAGPVPPAPAPVPGPAAARRVEELMGERIADARARLEEIEVDLSVFVEVEGLEAQLKEARLQAEQAKLERKIAELEAVRDHAALAARNLDVFTDQARIDSLFNVLKEETRMAKEEIETYRAARAQEIALLEARQPVREVENGALESEAGALISTGIAAWDDAKKANFLALVYAVAAELNVRIPQRLADGSTVQNDFVAVLERPEAAERQMALVALAAYRNRQNDTLDGTILGKPLAELIAERAVTTPRGRTYEIADAAKDAYLLDEVNAIWKSPRVTIGRWDLSKNRMTATAIARFHAGQEVAIPDGDLLALLAGVEQVVARYDRSEAVASELRRSHSEMLGQAKRHDLRLEGAANAVFQAEGLNARYPQQQTRAAEAARIFAEEAQRLEDPEAEPRAAELRRQAIALNEAAISIGRAELIAKSLLSR